MLYIIVVGGVIAVGLVWGAQSSIPPISNFIDRAEKRRGTKIALVLAALAASVGSLLAWDAAFAAGATLVQLWWFMVLGYSVGWIWTLVLAALDS